MNTERKTPPGLLRNSLGIEWKRCRRDLSLKSSIRSLKPGPPSAPLTPLSNHPHLLIGLIGEIIEPLGDRCQDIDGITDIALDMSCHSLV